MSLNHLSNVISDVRSTIFADAAPELHPDWNRVETDPPDAYQDCRWIRPDGTIEIGWMNPTGKYVRAESGYYEVGEFVAWEAIKESA